MINKERRGHARIYGSDVSLELHAGDFDSVAHTLNISESGLYCKVDRELPLMSRMRLMLLIPDQAEGSNKTRKVEAEGVVVRAHPVIIDGKIRHYDVAIFFADLAPKARDIIRGYIARKKIEPRER